MSRVRGKGNLTTEERLASLLRKARLRGWRRHQPLPGRPDFVWYNAGLVVFVDGCFWHGHDCRRNLAPKTNAQAWKEKFERNRRRDMRTARQLRRAGWSVIRIWNVGWLKTRDHACEESVESWKSHRPRERKVLALPNLTVVAVLIVPPVFSDPLSRHPHPYPPNRTSTRPRGPKSAVTVSPGRHWTMSVALPVVTMWPASRGRAARAQLVGEPDQGVPGVAEDVAAAPLRPPARRCAAR